MRACRLACLSPSNPFSAQQARNASPPGNIDPKQAGIGPAPQIRDSVMLKGGVRVERCGTVWLSSIQRQFDLAHDASGFGQDFDYALIVADVVIGQGAGLAVF